MGAARIWAACESNHEKHHLRSIKERSREDQTLVMRFWKRNWSCTYCHIFATGVHRSSWRAKGTRATRSGSHLEMRAGLISSAKYNIRPRHLFITRSIIGARSSRRAKKRCAGRMGGCGTHRLRGNDEDRKTVCALQAEKHLHGKQPLPPRHAETQLRGVQAKKTLKK